MNAPVTRFGLTKQQRRLLTYLREYIGQNGEAPSFEEMRTAFGWGSKQRVWEVLNALQERGFIWRDYNRPRSIKLLDPPIRINGEWYKFIPITPGVVNPFKTDPFKKAA